MIYANILNQDLSSLNLLSEKLIELLEEASVLITDKSMIHKFEQVMKNIDTVNLEYNKTLLEVKSVVLSTHYKKLSQLISLSDDDELIDTYNKTVTLTHKIYQKNKELHSLLELCNRLTTNHVNLLFGKTQKPTNYSFNQNQLHQHMLNTFKNAR